MCVLCIRFFVVAYLKQIRYSCLLFCCSFCVLWMILFQIIPSSSLFRAWVLCASACETVCVCVHALYLLYRLPTLPYRYSLESYIVEICVSITWSKLCTAYVWVNVSVCACACRFIEHSIVLSASQFSSVRRCLQFSKFVRLPHNFFLSSTLFFVALNMFIGCAFYPPHATLHTIINIASIYGFQIVSLFSSPFCM